MTLGCARISDWLRTRLDTPCDWLPCFLSSVKQKKRCTLFSMSSPRWGEQLHVQFADRFVNKMSLFQPIFVIKMRHILVNWGFETLQSRVNVVFILKSKCIFMTLQQYLSRGLPRKFATFPPTFYSSKDHSNFSRHSCTTQEKFPRLFFSLYNRKRFTRAF